MTDRDTTRTPPVLRTAVAAGGLATLGTLPIFLVSAQAVLIREDLRIDDARLGLAAGTSFGVAALVSLTCGGLLDRVSSRTSTLVAAVFSAGGTLGIALGARSFGTLLAPLVLAGVGNAALQMTANVTLARTVPPGSQGVAYGARRRPRWRPIAAWYPLPERRYLAGMDVESADGRKVNLLERIGSQDHSPHW